MRALNAQPLRRQIVLTAGVLLLLVAAAIGWTARRTRAERQEEIRQETAAVTRLATAYLNQYFDGLDAMASALVRHPAVTALDQAACRELFAAMMREQPLLLNVVLRDADGALVASGADASASGIALPAPAFVLDVLQTGVPTTGSVPTGPLTGEPSLGQAYPVQAAEGRLAGVLAFGLDLAHLQGVFSAISLPEGSVITLLDGSGRILARSLDDRYVGRSVTVRLPPAGVVVQPVLQTDVDGVVRVVGTMPIDRGGWALAVGVPQQAVMDRLATTWRNLSIGVIGVFMVLALSVWLSNHTSAGLVQLRAAAQRIAAGDLSPPEPMDAPNLEVAELQSAFTSMAINLRAARDAVDRQVEQERRMREIVQSLQRQVVRQERLAAVGVLVSGVAHELNNPLQAILGTAEILERHPALGAELLDEVSLIKTQSGRAREIIRNLSRFSSQQSGPPALVDLRTVIEEVVQLRRHALQKASIALAVEATGPGKVYANVTELEQVTLNFVINAQQAIESAGRSAGRILIRLVDDGRKVRLDVQDDGPGVAQADEAKLFQPFFTTKPVGQGTGLGLSVSYGIIESYGGVIGYRENEWHGATFFFELPSAGRSHVQDAAPARSVERR